MSTYIYYYHQFVFFLALFCQPRVKIRDIHHFIKETIGCCERKKLTHQHEAH
jgi:hypothetical protein